MPVGVPAPGGALDPLKYQRPVATLATGELFTVKLRFKRPDSDTSSQLELTDIRTAETVAGASSAFRMAAAVAAFAERLRAPQGKDGLDFAAIYQLAAAVELADPHGYRKEFLELVRRAEALSGRAARASQPGQPADGDLG